MNSRSCDQLGGWKTRDREREVRGEKETRAREPVRRYEALTDEESKKNWEEFGNPDGKQALEVSIGLPTFLLDEKNHYAILCIYLGVLVVVIPAIVTHRPRQLETVL